LSIWTVGRQNGNPFAERHPGGVRPGRADRGLTEFDPDMAGEQGSGLVQVSEFVLQHLIGAC
jgi:hypothetical protein